MKKIIPFIEHNKKLACPGENMSKLFSSKCYLFLSSLMILSACSPANEAALVSSESLSIPVESASLSEYSFGEEIVLGATVADKIFTFTKNASATEGADTTVSLDNTVDFSVVTATGCNKTLTKATEKCQVKIRFMKSKVAGSYEGVLSVGGNEVSLSASVASPVATTPALSVKEGTADVTSLAFGSLNKNSSLSKILTISNTGAATANLAVALTGDSNFSLSSNTCASTLAKGKSCAVKVLFASGAGSSSDESKSSSLAIASGVSVSLSATVLGTPVVVGSPLIKFYESSTEVSSLSFGAISSGSISKIITIKNEGNATASVSPILSGDSAFVVSSNTCSSSLAAGKNCAVKVALKISGESLGAKTASLSMGSTSLALSGTLEASGGGEPPVVESVNLTIAMADKNGQGLDVALSTADQSAILSGSKELKVTVDMTSASSTPSSVTLTLGSSMGSEEISKSVAIDGSTKKGSVVISKAEFTTIHTDGYQGYWPYSYMILRTNSESLSKRVGFDNYIPRSDRWVTLDVVSGDDNISYAESQSTLCLSGNSNLKDFIFEIDISFMGGDAIPMISTNSDGSWGYCLSDFTRYTTPGVYPITTLSGYEIPVGLLRNVTVNLTPPNPFTLAFEPVVSPYASTKLGSNYLYSDSGISLTRVTSGIGAGTDVIWSNPTMKGYSIQGGQQSDADFMSNAFFMGKYYFEGISANFSAGGLDIALFTYDPISNVVAPVFESFPAASGRHQSFPRNFTVFNNKLFLISRNSSGVDGFYSSSDGVNFNPISVASATSYKYVPQLGQMLYANSSGLYSSTDGQSFTKVNSYSGAERPYLATLGGNLSGYSSVFVSGKLYFRTDTKLYSYDGTTVSLVWTIPSGQLTKIAGASTLVYIEALDTTRKLYSFDTQTNTGIQVGNFATNSTIHPLRINTGAQGKISSMFAVLGNKIIFNAAEVATTNFEVWVSDGTVAGTKVLKEISPSGYTNPSAFTTYNGKMYFTGDFYNSSSCITFWSSDGTESGTTQILKDTLGNTINPLPSTCLGLAPMRMFSRNISTGLEFFVEGGGSREYIYQP